MPEYREGDEPIAGYRLLRILGRGSSGEVWKATDSEQPGRFVALKVIGIDNPHTSKELRSLEALKCIQHDHLLSIKFHQQIDDCLIIVTECCERSLWHRFKECQDSGESGIPKCELVAFMRQTAAALDFLNSPPHDIQHRDVKPHNILLAGKTVKLADFGIAKKLEGVQAQHTAYGTPYYISPEAIAELISKTSDQFSLAVTYCHLRTGVPPFDGDTVKEIERRILSDEPQLDGLTDTERRAVERALAKDPTKRWETCQQFVDALEAADPAPVRATPPLVIAKEPNDMAPNNKPIPFWRRPTDQRPGRLLVFGLVALALVAMLFSYLAFSPNSAELQPANPVTPIPSELRFAFTIDPPDAQLSIDRKDGIWEGTGGSRTLTISEPDQGAALRVTAELEGYQSLLVDLSPCPGRPSNYSLRLAAKPGEFDLDVVPETAIVKVVGSEGQLSEKNGYWRLVQTDPDGRRAITIEASHEGYEPTSEVLVGTPGGRERRSLKLRALPALITINVDPPDVKLTTDPQKGNWSGSGAQRTLTVPEPDQIAALRVTATLDGYQAEYVDLSPGPGQSSSHLLQLTPEPAVFNLEVSPATANVKVIEPDVELVEENGNWRLVQTNPDGRREITIEVSRKGYQSKQETLLGNPGGRETITLALERLPKPPLAKAPFSTEDAKKYQEVWAEYVGSDVQFSNSLEMQLVLIPPGEFMRGLTEAQMDRLVEINVERNREVQRQLPPLPGDEGLIQSMRKTALDSLKANLATHRVRLTQPYYLGTHEVTRGQFRRFVQAKNYKPESDGKGTGWNPKNKEFELSSDYSWEYTGFESGDDHPVVNVTWRDANEFCRWLSELEGVEYRLPTEAEWEYACRAGTSSLFYHGDDFEGLAQVENLADQTGKREWGDAKMFNVFQQIQVHRFIAGADKFAFSAPVGSFLRPNAWGLYDMHGNVSEWCADLYQADYYAKAPVEDPRGPDAGQGRVWRGGSWFNYADLCHSAFRGVDTPATRRFNLGFRIVRVVPSP